MKPGTHDVLRALKRHSLTPLEAFHELGTDRLAARVYEIRKAKGRASVERKWETTNGRRYARYFWRGQKAA